MQRNFGDHSANERTFLAWIRTSIAIIAFGFLVEKFTLFLSYIRQTLGQHAGPGGRGTEVVGFALMLLGALMIAVATVRFAVLERQIDQPTEASRPSVIPNVLLAVMLILIGLFLAIYVAHQLFAV